MIQKIAWKNIGRNKRRSLIVIFAVMLGTTMGVFATALVYGMFNSKIEDTIHLETSSLQIHHSDYLDNPEINLVVDHWEDIKHYLNSKNDSVLAFSPRISTNVMASTARASVGLTLLGINTNSNLELKYLENYTVKDGGELLSNGRRYPIVISDRTADHLSLKRYSFNSDSCVLPDAVNEVLQSIEGKRYREKKDFKNALKSVLSSEILDKYGYEILKKSQSYRLNSKIIMTMTNSKGELVTQYFRVCGIYKSSNAVYDSQYSYVLNRDLQKVLELPDDTYQEIAIVLNPDLDASTFALNMQKQFKDLDILPWQQLAPMASMISGILSYYSAMIMGFILFALLFGIINTMLMAILERKRELKMLVSIGMQPSRVFKMIVLETVLLTLVGALLGMLLASILISITSYTGISFGNVAEGFESMGFSSFVYPTLPIIEYFKVTLFVILAGILASLYPAYKALKK